MQTSITSGRESPKLVEVLNELIHLDYDAAEAYSAAIERLEDADTRAWFSGFRDDHQRHAHELSRLVRRLDAEPVTGPDARRILAQGKLVLSRLEGEKAVLQAMRSNANETNTRYEKALATRGLEARTRALLSRHLEDERRHRAWIVQRLETVSDQL